MKEIVEEELEEAYKRETYTENDHVIKMWQPLDFDIDENYEYVKKGKIFNYFSNMLYYGVAIPVLYVLTRLLYDLKIEGKENLENLKTGAITVSNHVLILDCAMVGLALDEKKVYYTTLEDSFKIPFIRHLIKLLRAIPIPTEQKNKPHFVKALDEVLKEGGMVHFYPEASLWPYYNKIRNFKTGAFRFALRNNVPIVPMIFTFRRPVGIRRVFKRKSDVTLTILEPITFEGEENRQDMYLFKEKVHQAMENAILEKKGKRKSAR